MIIFKKNTKDNKRLYLVLCMDGRRFKPAGGSDITGKHLWWQGQTRQVKQMKNGGLTAVVLQDIFGGTPGTTGTGADTGKGFLCVRLPVMSRFDLVG